MRTHAGHTYFMHILLQALTGAALLKLQKKTYVCVWTLLRQRNQAAQALHLLMKSGLKSATTGPKGSHGPPKGPLLRTYMFGGQMRFFWS